MYTPKRKHRPLQIFARTTWAIGWKDIKEAIKNKNTLAILFTSIPMIFVYAILPGLSERGEPPLVRVYDAGESQLTILLESSSLLNVRTYPSENDMQRTLMSADVPQLGLTIPARFDETLASGQEAELPGFVLNWVDASEAEQLKQVVASEITSLLGMPVTINLQERVYMLPESTGVGSTAAISLVFVITLIGLILTPHLILEEKLTHTIDALMLSPATPGSMMAGKAIAGIFYCLLGAAVALAVNHGIIVHWWLIALMIVLSSLVATSFGLILGSLINSRAQLSMLSWMFILPLMLPIFLFLLPELLPEGIIKVLGFFPSVSMLNLVRTAAAGSIPIGALLFQLTWLAAWAAGLLSLAAWSFRRASRHSAREAVENEAEEASSTPLLDAGMRWLGSLVERVQPPRLQPAPAPAGLDSGWDAGSEVIMSRPSRWQITWAIAAKDISATIKNKLALSIMLGTAIMLATNAFLPLLLQARDLPVVIAYDAGRSSYLRELSTNETMSVGIVASQEEMEETVSQSREVFLGLVIPDDFDHLAERGETIRLDAYVVHWANPEVVSQRAAFFGGQLANLTGNDVQIEVAEDPVYPPADGDGQILLVALTFAIILFAMGIALVPLLFVEERQAHTLDVLLVSPARILEIVNGKALAGLFYCLLAAVVMFIFNRYLVVHWGVAWLAVLLGAAFAVSIGLLVGLISESATTMGLWGSLILLGMLGLTLVGIFSSVSGEPGLNLLFEYLPSTALVNLLSFSMAGEISAGPLFANAAVLLTSVLVVLALVGWQMRRMDA